jgi:hypothetical protein
MTGTDVVAALRDWMLDLHRMGRIFSDDQREAAETAAMHAADGGASYEQAFHAGVAAVGSYTN